MKERADELQRVWKRLAEGVERKDERGRFGPRGRRDRFARSNFRENDLSLSGPVVQGEIHALFTLPPLTPYTFPPSTTGSVSPHSGQ